LRGGAALANLCAMPPFRLALIEADSTVRQLLPGGLALCLRATITSPSSWLKAR